MIGPTSSGSRSTLLLAKLTPPHLPDAMVERTRLLDTLQQSGSCVLTILVAPPGSGKTTVAVNLLERIEGHCGWVTLEPADNDPVRFWSYVAGAVTDGETLEEIQRVLADGPMALDTAVDHILRVVEERTDLTTIVLDDFQNITNPDIERRLGEVLRHPPARLRLLLTSRDEPNLPIGRLRTHGCLTELRRDELAFRADETSQLITGLTSKTYPTIHADWDALVNELTTRTEGWAAGLHLAGLALRTSTNAEDVLNQLHGASIHLSEYLAQEALQNQPDDTRQFLLDTSILAELDPSLCDSITGRVDSLQVLRGLASRNVFTVAVDELDRSFRYHQLFRQHLRDRLEATDKQRSIQLNLDAASWYEGRGHPGKAIRHAVAGGDRRWAVEIINSVWIEFCHKGRLQTVKEWVNVLGKEWVFERSDLCLIMAWGSLNDGDYAECEYWAERTLEAKQPEGSWTQQEVIMQVAALHAYRHIHLGDPNAAVAELEPFVELLSDRSSPVSVHCFSAYLTAQCWIPEQTPDTDKIGQTITDAMSTDMGSAVVSGHMHLALLAADSGDSERALAHADAALSNCDDEFLVRFHRPAVAHLARAIAFRSEGKLADAQFELDAADPLARSGVLPLCLTRIELERARLSHILGHREEQLAAVRRARTIVADTSNPSALDLWFRSVENETRFAPTDDRHLPVGARELTERELSIVRLSSSGLSRRELASQLHISENTLKTHLLSIRRKLGLQGRADIAARARDLGLIPGAETSEN